MDDCIGFSTTKAWVSRIIRWFTGAAVSHAWLLYYDVDFGQTMVLEATLEGVRIIPYEAFKRHNLIVRVFTPRHSLKPGLIKAGDTLGEHYDFTGLLGMLWVLFGRWLRRKWRNPWIETHAMFCSEFVAQVLQWAAYPDTEHWIPAEMTPEDLYEFFCRREAQEATLNVPRSQV
jgi:hypothetical protein